jgi:hypothetical protein
MNAQLDWLSAARETRRKGTKGLLADLPRARATDPETSHQAAEEVRRSGRLTKQQGAVLDAVQKYPGSTAVELSRWAGLDRHAVSRRLPEIQPVHVRRGAPRECTINGRPQSTWYPVRR